MEKTPQQEPELSDPNNSPQAGDNEPKNQDQASQSPDLKGSGTTGEQKNQADNLAGSEYEIMQFTLKPGDPVQKKSIFNSIGDRLRQGIKGHGKDVSIKNASKTDLAEDYFNRGVASFKNRDLDQAINYYGQAIQLRPDFIKAYNNRGMAFFLNGDLKRAFSDFNRAIQLDPNYASSYEHRALIYSQNGDLEHAISDYDRAIQLNPKELMSHINRGFAYYQKGDLERAISDYDQELKVNPNFAAAYNNRGLAYDKKGNFEGAIRDYDQALQINPNYGDAYFNRGLAYSNKGDYIRAISDYDKAIEINPNDTHIYASRAVAYVKKGNLERAIADCSEAIQLNPKEMMAYYSRGFIYGKNGQTENAIADFKKVLELCGNNVAVRQIAMQQLKTLDETVINERIAYEAFCEALNKMKPGWMITERGIAGPGNALVRLAQRHASFAVGHFDILFVFDENASPGLELWDCVSGLGKSVADKAKNAAHIWSVTTACTYFELRYSLRGEFAAHLHGSEPGAFPGWHTIPGAISTIGEEESHDILQKWWLENPVLPILSDVLSGSLDEQHPHGIKIMFGRDNIAEVRVDGEVHEAASEALKNLGWPRLKLRAHLRTYLLVTQPETVITKQG